MKVIYVVDNYSYRPEKSSKTLIDGLNRYMKLLGIATEIWFYKPSENKIGLKKDFIDEAPIKYIYFPRKLENISSRKKLRQIFGLNKPNLIHIFDPTEMTNLFKYVIKIKIPYIITFTEDGLINELTSDDETGNFKKMLENALLVTVTTKEKKEILNRAGLNTNDLLVIQHNEMEKARSNTSVRLEEIESELFRYFQIYNIVM